MTGVDLGEFEEAGKRKLACWFALLPFTDEQRQKLAVACDERPDIKHKTISVVLASWKFDIEDGSVARHRKRECKCPKP